MVETITEVPTYKQRNQHLRDYWIDERIKSENTLLTSDVPLTIQKARETNSMLDHILTESLQRARTDGDYPEALEDIKKLHIGLNIIRGL